MPDIHALVTANNLAFGAVSFLLGFLLGHWLALGRDKRKDFNELSAPVFEALLKQREQFARGIAAQAVGVPLQRLNPLLPIWQRVRLRSCAKRYEQAVAKALACSAYEASTGEVTSDGEAVRAVVPAIDPLLRLLEPR